MLLAIRGFKIFIMAGCWVWSDSDLLRSGGRRHAHYPYPSRQTRRQADPWKWM